MAILKLSVIRSPCHGSPCDHICVKSPVSISLLQDYHEKLKLLFENTAADFFNMGNFIFENRVLLATPVNVKMVTRFKMGQHASE